MKSCNGKFIDIQGDKKKKKMRPMNILIKTLVFRL